MTVKYSGFEHFLANNVVYRVGSLIALYPKANAVFKKHIDRIITAAERYGEWLRAEYKKAEKRGLTDLRKQLHGKGYRTFLCSGWDWRDVFFETAGGQRYLWIKGEPRPNPLDYLRSMVWGRISKPPCGISLLDYQYFLAACIYDSQRQAGERHIYFSPEPEDSAVWDKQLKDRICRRVWLVLVKGQRETMTQIDITRDQMIEPGLRAIEAEQTGGDKSRKRKPKAPTTRPEYSLALPMTRWAYILGVSPNTLRKMRKQKKYHFKQKSDRRWTLPIHELPAEYLAKYRLTLPKTPPKAQ